MSAETSDPYSTFLDLPPGPRPPHYYDVLRLELFCSHHERINHAVRKQFRLVKPFHDHPDRATREAVQDLMNTIAGARVTLTDPARKEEYDRQLAKRLGVDRDALLASQIAAPVPDHCLLVVAGPSLVTRRFDLIEGTPFTMGTDPRCSLTLESNRVALRHCQIEHRDGEWLLNVSDPERSVRVNDDEAREAVLTTGDRVDVGGFRFLFSLAGKDAPATTRADRLPPPLTLIVRKGASTLHPMFSALPPQRFTIGHANNALWQLPDRGVSKLHCAVQSVGDRWEIEDLDSRTGTSVNGTECLRRLLSDRDMLGIGGFEILTSLRH